MRIASVIKFKCIATEEWSVKTICFCCFCLALSITAYNKVIDSLCSCARATWAESASSANIKSCHINDVASVSNNSRSREIAASSLVAITASAQAQNNIWLWDVSSKIFVAVSIPKEIVHTNIG